MGEGQTVWVVTGTEADYSDRAWWIVGVASTLPGAAELARLAGEVRAQAGAGRIFGGDPVPYVALPLPEEPGDQVTLGRVGGEQRPWGWEGGVEYSAERFTLDAPPVPLDVPEG